MICYYLIRWSQCQQHLKIVNSRVFWQTMFDYKRVLLCPSLKRDDDIQSLRFCNESKAPTIWCNGTPVITILYYIYIKFIHQKNGTTTLFKLNIIENKIKTLDSPALWSWCPARRKKNVPSSGTPERSAVPKVVRFEWSPELGGGYWKLPSYTQRRNPTATASSTDQKVKNGTQLIINDATCYPLKMVIP